LIGLWQRLRQPPLVAPAGLREQPGLTFGFTTESEPGCWTVTAYGSDGRQLGRPLKALSDAAQTTLRHPASQTTDASELQRLADAWTDACKHGSTNADVLTDFADAAALISQRDAGTA
jgi:hypothetical protein